MLVMDKRLPTPNREANLLPPWDRVVMTIMKIVLKNLSYGDIIQALSMHNLELSKLFIVFLSIKGIVK